MERVIHGMISSAYVLCRPPGHHALSNKGMGFCIFNNVAVAAKYLMNSFHNEFRKVAIMDYDVHHGNGTEDTFYDGSNVLFVSIHQYSNFPPKSDDAGDIGSSDAKESTINIPLPPGSGSGAYQCAFIAIVLPALHRFEPDFILVSSGFDILYRPSICYDLIE